MGSSRIAQGDWLSALRWPRGVGYGGWEGCSRGRGCGDMNMHMADSLFCATGTNTVLWSNYTPIKIYLKKMRTRGIKHPKSPRFYEQSQAQNIGPPLLSPRASDTASDDLILTQPLMIFSSVWRSQGWKDKSLPDPCPGWPFITCGIPQAKPCKSKCLFKSKLFQISFNANYFNSNSY